MHDLHFNSLDLNLLRVFDTLIEERSVTRAGERLGLSQSAISHALSRLRYALNDELFVRMPDGMRPTVRARDRSAPQRRSASAPAGARSNRIRSRSNPASLHDRLHRICRNRADASIYGATASTGAQCRAPDPPEQYGGCRGAARGTHRSRHRQLPTGTRAVRP